MTSPNRNITLDYFKLILAIVVVTIHTNLFRDGLLGWLVSDGIARVAVPCFLIINGYFFAQIIDDKQKTKQYFIKLLVIYIAWNSVYFPYLWHTVGGGRKALLFNLFIGYYHLWYMVALIGASLLLYITRKINRKIMLCLSFVLFVIGCIIQKVGLLGIFIHMYPVISRSFLFMGFPFLFMGYYIYKNKLVEKSFAKGKLVFILTAIFAILLLVESYLIYPFKIYQSDPRRDDFYFTLIFLCPLLFLSVLKISKYGSSDGYISKLGSSIYFVHILVIFTLSSPYISGDSQMLPIYLFLSALLSVGVIEINKRIKIFL